MPALVLFQMQRFLTSENTDWPASSSSPMCRQSMHTNAMAPLRASAAACPSVRCRKRVKAATDISPAPMANSRWRMRPSPVACPSMGTLLGRIGEDEVSPFGSHQPIEHIVVSGIAADQAMAVEAPHITWPGDGGGRITGAKRDLVLDFSFG